MKIYKNIFFLFFIFFYIKSEDDIKSPKFLLELDSFFQVNLLSRSWIKFGVQYKFSCFSYKLNFDKYFHEIGVMFELINIIALESLCIGADTICKFESVQDMKIMGYSFMFSFRTWYMPLNVGLRVCYTKFSPKLAYGIVLHFIPDIHKFVGIGLIGNVYKIHDKNVEGLIDQKDYYSAFSKTFSSDLLNVVQNNQYNCKQNDFYFANYMKITNFQLSIQSKIDALNKLSNNNQWELFFEELDKFEEVELTNLQNLLKESFLIIKDDKKIKFNYFSNDELKLFFKFLNKINNDINKEKEKIENKKLDDIEYDTKNYLNFLVAKELYNPIYMIEIKDTNLKVESEREEILSDE